uniref:Selenoprotein P n=1 Tax=Gopherus evgoodei TaxID=1825980 RepID=A0A8C4Y207_9SAUR
MWGGLGLALVLCLLPGGGTENQGSRAHCKEPPGWQIEETSPMQNSRGSVTVVALLQANLRVKLENEGLVNISYMVVNHQGIHSQLKIHTLREKVSENITVYQQSETQTDVWTTLNGNKDDVLIYDRCGRLVYHLGLPYSFLTFPYVEDSIKIAYCEYKCGNCSYMKSKSWLGCQFQLLNCVYNQQTKPTEF